QFGPNEDYLRYPRPFQKDIKLCRKANVDYVFAPSTKEMYGDNYLTYVEVEKLSEILCGKFRPGHFRGVATVVAKLFNITKPHRAYFGEKDYQQLKIIQKMTKDLNFPVEIVPCKTVREENGLASSSRNVYLSKDERREATKIYQTLKEVQEAISSHKIKTVEEAINYIRKKIQTIKNAKIDYIKICDSETLQEQNGKIQLGRILVAVWVGKARLIDNVEI
ncbi:MAG: pantoate--beta-alanine ligase, partial [Elusimicrobiota bacterium]|nr:pantoate--beta-alanine ligase [Elusimicrobiota bacterium]